MDPADEGVRYPPNRLRDGLHRLFFKLAAGLGPDAQGWLLQRFFELKYRTPDPWSYAATPYQRQKAGLALSLIPIRAYQRVLEVGCGEGVFSSQLLAAREVREFLGIDISDRALARAREQCTRYPQARFETRNILASEPTGPFDLIILCEILYYLGDSAPQLARMTARLLSPEGIVVLVHPWPEARELHAHFGFEPGLELHDQVVEAHTLRDYCVSVFTKKLT
jgi:2-polyprenyl-3-methyl-5-hydroxy-6-metoxy-1,4-benzoquinol methylase